MFHHKILDYVSCTPAGRAALEGCAPRVSMAEVAARKGNLHALQAAWYAGAEVGTGVLNAAHEHGHLHIMRWIEWNVPGHAMGSSSDDN
jgi:hypothetical protein